MKYKTPPYKHQKNIVEDYYNRPYGALFLEQGLGKTKILLDIVANSSNTNAVLVLAPNGLHANWYYKEVKEHYDGAIGFFWQGPIKTQKAKIAANVFFSTEVPPNHKRFLFMNSEAIRTKNGYDFAILFLQRFQDNMVVIDESSCIKNPKAKITKAALKLRNKAKRRFILSGTPITQGPMDLFSQAKFLSEYSIPYKTYTSYKATFAIEEMRYAGARSFKKITGYKNLDHLTEIMKPFSIRLRKKDCLDLPEKLWQTQLVAMTASQKKAYEDLKNNALTVLEESKTVSSTLPLTTIIKLQQICSGFVTTDEGEEIDLDNNKIKALLSIAETTRPLVIFCAFRKNIAQVIKAISEIYDPSKIASIVGGNKSSDRSSEVARFQKGDAEFMVCTSAGAKGLTLTRSSHLVYYSNSYSLETRLQSQDRIHRIGQNDTCVYTDLVVQGSIDEKILQILQSKKDLSNMVLDELITLIKQS